MNLFCFFVKNSFKFLDKKKKEKPHHKDDEDDDDLSEFFVSIFQP